MKDTTETKRYPDSIQTDNGRVVRLSQLNPKTIITIRNKKIAAGDIPLAAARLNCGHVVRGIALQKRDRIFCEEHHEETSVAEILAS